MRYLVFDLEYATSKGGVSKICEFGYVVTNEKYEIIEKGNFIIDPSINRNEWDYRVVRRILTRKIWEYEKSPRFDEYYEEIVDLINEADYVLGHSLDGDAKALNDECKRYGLRSIDFDFYDIKLFYKAFNNSRKDTSVTNILSELKIEGDKNEHAAEADAYNTMLELKTMLEILNLSLEELIELCPEAKNKNNDYVVESIAINQMIREEKFEKELESTGDNTLRRGHKNSRLFLQFLDNVQPQVEYDKKLQGLKFSISINYEENHYKQMLNIVQLLCNYGATYVMKASLADIFVKYDILLEDGTIKPCSKLKYVTEGCTNGSKIKIISFESFMDMLGISEQQLNDMPMVSFDCLYREDAIIKDSKTKKLLQTKNKQGIKINVSSDTGTTLGDLFPDLFKKLKGEED